MTDTVPTLTTSLEAEHRELDQLLGRFLAATTGGDGDAAGAALKEFDEILRSHTRREEERLYEKPAGRKLVPARDEAAEMPWRELLLEHVQIREVSGMMRRLLEEKSDLAAARALCGNLARRWEAHTIREEREVFPLYGQEVDDKRA
jgi:Hemerythrin HHE cation binding domain